MKPIDINPRDLETVRSILSHRVPDREVRAFGSRVTWTAKEFSDLDLAVMGNDPLPRSVLTELEEDFRESDLPFKVDVLDWATTKKNFRRIIEKEYVVLQKAEGKKRDMAGEWGKTTLDKLGRIITGKTPPSTHHEYFGGETPFVTPTDFDGRRIIENTARYLSEGGTDFLNNSRIPAGAVMVSCIGSDMGKVAVAGRDCVTNQQINSIVVDSGDDPLFVYYNLSTRKAEIRAAAGGSAQPILNKSAFGRLDILQPPIKEQRAIAHILGTLDDKIELNRRMNETLEGMARAIFKSWFIDFDPVRRNIARRSGQSQPSPQPSPSGRGSSGKCGVSPGGGGNYRGGYDFAGLLETTRALRKNQTSAEAIFWELVRDHRFMGLKFRRQHQLGDYVADFYCHEHRLVIELDGGIHQSKRKKDHKRDAWMEAQGFKVLRFANGQVLEDPQSVLERIAAHCSCAGEGMPPSPYGRRAEDEGCVEAFSSSPFGRGGGEGSVEELDRLFPDSFQDSELGQIPKGWKVGRLGDVADHPRRGVQPSAINPSTPYIALEHMPKRCIALADWGIADGLESNKFEFKKGEILFGKLRPYFHKVGVAPLDGVCSTDIVVVASRTEKWFGFVLGHVSSVEFVDFTNAGATGTKMPRTSWHEMARYPVVLPQEPVAEAFSNRIRLLSDRIIASIHESRSLATIRDALLPKLLSGEIRIKDPEKFTLDKIAIGAKNVRDI